MLSDLSPPELDPGLVVGVWARFSGMTQTRRNRWVLVLLRADRGVPESSGCESSPLPLEAVVAVVPEELGRFVGMACATATCTAWLPFTGPAGLAFQPTAGRETSSGSAVACGSAFAPMLSACCADSTCCLNHLLPPIQKPLVVESRGNHSCQTAIALLSCRRGTSTITLTIETGH